MRKEKIPDELTILRLVLGVIIVLFGFWGREKIATITLLLLLGWTSDIIDGRLARRYKEEPGWIGKWELIFDLSLCLGALAFLGLTGLLPLIFPLVYIAVSGGVAFFALALDLKTANASLINGLNNLLWVLELPLVFLTMGYCLFFSPRWIIEIFLFWAGFMLGWDWQRAMELKKGLVDLLRNFWQGPAHS